MKKFKYQIYKIINMISGKIYIGQHKIKFKESPRMYMGSRNSFKSCI